MIKDQNDDKPTDRLADDLLMGAAQIGDEGGWSPRRAFYLLQRGDIPGFKIGSIWHSRRSTLRAFIEERERAAMAKGRTVT